MCQIDKIMLSIHNYIIKFLIYMSNMIKFIIPKKKYAKIHPIPENECIYKNIPSTYYYIKSYNFYSSMYNLNLT